MNGWVKLHRQILDNEFLSHDNTAYIVFSKLLLIVNPKTGNYSSGRFNIGQRVGIYDTTLYKCLKRLEKHKMVTLSSNNRFTTIHICNWKDYQSNGNSPGNNEVTTNEQPSNTLVRSKEVKNKENTKVLAKATTIEINEMFEYWQQTTGMPIASRVKQNRYACSNLIKKHGSDGVRRLVSGVAQAQADQYAPRISDFTQLQARLGDLLLWGKKNTTKKGVTI